MTNAENEHRSFERVLGSHDILYFRLNPIIEEAVTLSNFKKINYLKEETKNYLTKRSVQGTLEKFCSGDLSAAANGPSRRRQRDISTYPNT